jgi:predicted amidohydrolase YtcJ
LDAYEEAMNANPRSDPRHRIEHAILTTPQATKRMKDLGVVVCANPQFLYIFGEGYEKTFSNLLSRIIVTREWLESGVHMTIGSDAPSMPWYMPQATILGAISRLTFKKNVIGKDQALTFMEALRAHTIEAAYAAHEENIKGSLEGGKLADIVVWSQDPTTASLEDLFKMPPMFLTLVGGKIVHKA